MLIGKPIDDLLANNTNHRAISHHFQDMADYWSNFHFNALAANIQIHFTSPETISLVTVLPDTVNHTIPLY